jgi:ribosomal protein S18 acetylase RimI-like enzyme
MSAAGEPGSAASPGPADSTSIPIHLRPARAGDVTALVPLLLRLKRLHEEFDPLLRVRDDAESQAREVLKAAIADPQTILLAAEGVGPDKDKVVGFVNAVLRERPFYAPSVEGVIVDIYLLPLYRRHGVGEYVLKEVSAALKAKGAGVVIAEFPAQNEIATRFYAKRGFRPITARHARLL